AGQRVEVVPVPRRLEQRDLVRRDPRVADLLPCLVLGPGLDREAHSGASSPDGYRRLHNDPNEPGVTPASGWLPRAARSYCMAAALMQPWQHGCGSHAVWLRYGRCRCGGRGPCARACSTALACDPDPGP